MVLKVFPFYFWNFAILKGDAFKCTPGDREDNW